MAVAISPPAAWASPALRAAAAAATPATVIEKAAAIRALEIEPSTALTGLADCALVTKLWQLLDGAEFRDEIRAAAAGAFTDPAALAGDGTTCTTFIKTGIFEAKARDLVIEQRIKAQRQAELDLKKQAAQTIGLATDAALLALSVKDFVWQIRERSTGAGVRAAAEIAFNGTDAARIAFLSGGIADAHEADRRRQIAEDHKDDIAEQQRLIEVAARESALAILLTIPTAEMLAASDRDFITYLWEHAKANSQVRATAQTAVLSRDPLVWNLYIHEGMRTAYNEDIRLEMQRKHEADIAEVDKIIVTAVADGHFNLGHAAKAARAAKPLELDDFLRRGRFDLDLNTSFATGQVVPTWTNTPVSATAIKNVVGVCCDLKAPELKVENGALLYSGMDKDPIQSFAYLKLMNLSGIVVKPATTLSYTMNLDAFSNGDNGSCVAVDLLFGNGLYLRESGLKDTKGNRAHPAHQCGHLPRAKTTKVVVPLGALAGQAIARLDVGYDQPANIGAYRGRISNITISDEPAPPTADAAAAATTTTSDASSRKPAASPAPVESQ